MARNTPLEPPPVEFPFVEKNGVITSRWAQWIQRLHLLKSNKNHQTITGACAVNLDANYVFLIGGSAPYAVTLDVPTLPGIFKAIEMTQYNSNAVTLALTNCQGGTASSSCSWGATNQILLMMSTATKWEIYKQQGVTLT